MVHRPGPFLMSFRPPLKVGMPCNSSPVELNSFLWTQLVPLSIHHDELNLPSDGLVGIIVLSDFVIHFSDIL